MDAERAERGARGPLHGIPFVVKDVYIFIMLNLKLPFFHLLD